MIYNKLPLNDAFVIELDKKVDDRGFFSRVFCEEEFKYHNLNNTWKQINNSFNYKKLTLRGLHYQKFPKQEVKLVRCIKGVIWDVIVDLRPDSTTFGSWYGEELSEYNRKMMYVPKGFAHGFLSLTDNTELYYLSSEFYSPEHEATIRWDDKLHQIKWPFDPLIMSDKDKFVTDFKI